MIGPALIALGVIALIIIVAIVLVIKNTLFICSPNQVLIFSGGKVRYSDNIIRGYRIIKGGRGIRIPLLEKVSRMDLTNMIIEVNVSNAYTKGGIPLAITGVANIKIAGVEPIIHNALERFLDKSKFEIMKIAKETLEGNLRGVMASLTPEQVNEDKEAFTRTLLGEAGEDFGKLGLVLDTLQIQKVTDQVSYLNSIGRVQNASLLREAKIAEAQNASKSAIEKASNRQAEEIANLTADISNARSDADKRLAEILSRRDAMIAEVEGDVKAQIVKSTQEIEVQKARIIMVKNRLIADRLEPALALKSQKISQAKGKSAKILEDGKAQVEGLSQLVDSWKKAGANAKDIFILQKLKKLLGILVGSVGKIEVDSLHIFSDPNTSSTAITASSLLEQLKKGANIDVPALVRSLSTMTQKKN